MKLYSRALLLIFCFTMTANSALASSWSFSNVTSGISNYSLTDKLSNLFNPEAIQKRFEDTFVSKWHYAAAGLIALPAVLALLHWNKKDPKAVEGKKEPAEDQIDQSSEKPASAATSSASDNASPDTPNRSTGEQPGKPQNNEEIQDEEESFPLEVPIVNQEQPAQNEMPVYDSLSDVDPLTKGTIYQLDGKTIYKELQENNHNIPTESSDHLEAIVRLIQYFYACAKNKHQLFSEGTFIIDDSDFKIFDFMYNYVVRIYGTDNLHVESPTPKMCSAYPRPSSHLEKYYSSSDKMIKQAGWFTTNYVKNPEYTHYGIDINTAAETQLPIGGMHHILFGKVDDRRIFIKMEDHGLQSTDFVRHTFGFVNSLGRKLVPAYFGSDDGPTMRKERVPKEPLQEFKKLIQQICNTQEAAEYAKKAEGLGICFMIKILQEKVQNCVAQKWQYDANTFINSLNETYDYTDTRIGREVILKVVDFN